jgi:hypothetical protein
MYYTLGDRMLVFGMTMLFYYCMNQKKFRTSAPGKA